MIPIEFYGITFTFIAKLVSCLFCSSFTIHYVYKVFPVRAIKAYMGRRCIVPVILNLKNT